VKTELQYLKLKEGYYILGNIVNQRIEISQLRRFGHVLYVE